MFVSYHTATTACPLDCPDACSLEVDVDQQGRLQEIRGSHVNPLTEGFICSKVRHFSKHLYGEERVLRPGVRTGPKGQGRFRDVSWNEALDLIVEKIQNAKTRVGGEAILPLFYGGSNGMLSQDATDLRFFSRLGASQLARTVCAAPSTAAATGLYGKMPGVAFGDYQKARLIVLWGVNPSVSGIHLVPHIRKAQKQGTRLVVIDPRRTNLAKLADLHLQLRPGTDLPLALSLIHYLFQEEKADLDFLERRARHVEVLRQRAATWSLSRAAREAAVEVSDLRQLAEWYAEISPAVIRCGWGAERNRNGGSAIAAILALPAVAGKFGVPGGGYTLSNTGAWRLQAGPVVAADSPGTRTVNMNHIGRVLQHADPPVEVLFVYNCNPLATLPNQEAVRKGLERDNLFSIVFDQVMTDTARVSDVVLPATTFLEHQDLRGGYGAMVLQPVQPVLEPLGEARSNFQVFAELSRRLDLELPGDVVEEEEFSRRILASEEGLLDQISSSGRALPKTGFAPVQFEDCLPLTPDQKIHLCPEKLDREAPFGLYHYQPDPTSPEWPLALISPSTGRTISSTFGQLHRKVVPIEIHPADAAKRQVVSGDRVEIWNSLGRVVSTALVSEDVRPGTLFLPKGLWSHNTLNGATANALAPDSLTDLAEGACFNDARVELKKI